MTGDMDLQTAMTVGAPALMAVVWLVRLEGRINGHDRELTAAEKRDAELREDVKYIRDRIDRALNGHEK